MEPWCLTVYVPRNMQLHITRNAMLRGILGIIVERLIMLLLLFWTVEVLKNGSLVCFSIWERTPTIRTRVIFKIGIGDWY
jgi:hypothetical protein